MNKIKPRWATAFAALTIVAGVASGTVGNMVEEQQAQAAAAASYQSYVDNATMERKLHNAVNDAHGRLLFARAYDAQQAELDLLKQAIAEAEGKVDTTAQRNAIYEYSRIDTPAQMYDRADLAWAAAKDLRAQVKAYDEEQARIAAERAAAEAAAAAQAAAEAQAYSDTSGDSSGSTEAYSAGASYDHTEWVAGYGGQDLIDACVGSVMYDYGGGHYGLAEHWSCGGYEFPTWAGAIINIPGYGVYRTTGIEAILDIDVNTGADAPAGFFYQTCLGGDTHNMAFIGLERIG